MDPRRVPKRYDVVVVDVVVDGVVVTFWKNAQGFLNMQRTVTKLRKHIRDLIPERSTISDV